MASEIRVNRLSNRSGLSTITFANGGVQFSGITTFANGEFYVGTGATIINPGTNEFNFHTGGSNRFTINNSGANLGTGNITAVDATFTGNVSIGKTLTYEDVKNVDSVGVVTARTGVKVTGGDFTVGTAITASSVTGNVTQDVGITTFSGSATWFKGLTANKDMYWSKSSGSLIFKDNAAALFGDGSDLQIYHDSSFSRIKDTGTNALIIQSGEIRLQNEAANETMAIFISDGASELYYNNSKKFETFTAGFRLCNNSAFTMNSDSSSIYFGADDDMRILHDGSNGIIRNTTGNLRLEAKNGELAVRAIPDGAVELYYNNAKTLETYVNRLTLTGNASECNIYLKTSDGTTRGILASTNSNSVTLWGGSTKALEYASNALTLYHTGNAKLATTSSGVTVTGRVDVAGSQNAQLTSNQLIFDRAGTSYVDNNNNSGSLSFRVTASNTVALLLDSSAQATFGSSLIIPDSIIHSGDTNTKIRFPAADTIQFETGGGVRAQIGSGSDYILRVNNTNSTKRFSVKETTTSSGVYYNAHIGGGSHLTNYAVGIGFDPEGYAARVKIGIVAEGTSQGWSRGKLHFLLDSANDSGEATLAESRMTITDAGKVGINQSSPSQTLHIRGHSGSNLPVYWIREGSSVGGYLYSDGGGSGIVGGDGVLDNTGIYLFTDTRIDFRVNGSERLRIDSGGTTRLKRSTISNSATTASNAALYLDVGDTEGSASYHQLIGFGYRSAVTNAKPAYIGYQGQTWSGHTYGDLIFGTRNTTTGSDEATERLRITSDGHSYLAGRQYLGRSGTAPVAGASNLRETFFQAIAASGSHTFQISNTYGGGLVYIVGSRYANANIQTTKIYAIAVRTTANAHLSSAIASVNGQSGSFSFTVTGASKGITVTNNDSTYSCNCFVTFDVTGFTA